jgi:hypothetical protein
MTKVFVWKNYGEVNVYAFETVVQQSILTGVVHKCARSNAIDPMDAEIIDDIYHQDISFEHKINALLGHSGIAFDNETFEHGTGFVEVQE